MKRKIIKVGDKIKVQYWYLQFESEVKYEDGEGYLHIDPDNYLYDKDGHAYQRLEDGSLKPKTNKGISKLWS